MADPNTEALVRESRFFGDMPSESLGGVARLAQVVELAPHKRLFEQYDLAKNVYIVISGQVSLVICETPDSCRQIAALGEGELIGWSPIVGRARLADTAVTITPFKALCFDGKELMEFAAANPEFGFAFMRKAAATLASRLSATRLHLLELSGVSLPIFDVQWETD